MNHTQTFMNAWPTASGLQMMPPEEGLFPPVILTLPQTV